MGKIVELPNSVIGGANDPAEWGGCPKCHMNDGFLNADDGIGMGQWFWCKRHKLKWHVGTNLFSMWQHMSKEDLNWQAFVLAECQDVEPWHPRLTIVEDRRVESKTTYDEQRILLWASGYIGDLADDTEPF